MKVIRIDPQRQNRKFNVAAYARVSTLSEEQEESFETQVEYYSSLIRGNDKWNFIKVYADQGKSGMSVSKRSEFNQMLDDALNGKIDIIITKSISRFGRNSLEAQSYVNRLKEKGIEVRFEREGISSLDPQSDMIFSFLSAVAQEESKSISMNIQWTYEKLAEKGIRHLGNKRILGYDEIDGVLKPNTDAWVIRFIFEEYSNNKSMRTIARELKEKQVKTLRNKDILSTSTISRILKNEIYMGDRRLQKAPHNNLITHKPEKEAEYKSYYISNAHEAIVSKELWNKVQIILEASGKRKHK